MKSILICLCLILLSTSSFAGITWHDANSLAVIDKTGNYCEDIQTAVDTLNDPSSYGGTVRLVAAGFDFCAPIVNPCNNPVIIEGYGHSTVIRNPATAMNLFVIGQPNVQTFKCGVRNLHISGGSNILTAIKLINVDWFILENIWMYSGTRGVHIVGDGSGMHSYHGNIHNIALQRQTDYGLKTEGINGGSSGAHMFSNSVFKNQPKGVWFKGSGGSHLMNNVFFETNSATDEMLRLEDSRYNNISGQFDGVDGGNSIYGDGTSTRNVINAFIQGDVEWPADNTINQ